MRSNRFQNEVINLKKRRFARKYKALFSLFTRIRYLFKKKSSQPSIRKDYKKTINH